MSVEAIWDKIDEAKCFKDIAFRRSRLEECIDELWHLVHRDEKRGWYPMGYAYYCHPDRISLTCPESMALVKCLKKSISLQCECALSYLYLAFHYYDFHEYDLAQQAAEVVCGADLIENMEIRYRELVVCITIASQGIDESSGAVASYCRYLSSLKLPDVAPLNLLNVIESQVRGCEVSESVRETLRNLDSAYIATGENQFSELIKS